LAFSTVSCGTPAFRIGPSSNGCNLQRHLHDRAGHHVRQAGVDRRQHRAVEIAAMHRTAGRLSGLEVTYDRLIPKDMGLSFEQVFELTRTSGYTGINVTYPYKEIVTGKVIVADPLVRAIGAINTVVFEAGA